MIEDFKHFCSAPTAMRVESNGSACDQCLGDEDGTFWADNGEYTSQVNYCPFCGMKAPTQIKADV